MGREIPSLYPFVFVTASKVGRRAAPFEIAFLENYGVKHEILELAAELAERQGVSPEAALLGEGLVPERLFYASLADWLGAPYYDSVSSLDPGPNVNAAILSGFAGMEAGWRQPRVVIAPREAALQLLLETSDEERGRLPIAIASRQRLGATLRAKFGDRIARDAALQLETKDPTLSARRRIGPVELALLLVGLAGVALLSEYTPLAARTLVSACFWALFSCAVWLRSAAVAAKEGADSVPSRVDAELPAFTVVAALYREANVVAALVRALDALDYPRAKLDIKLVVERDDRATLEAIAALRLPARYDVIVAPRGQPMTKPRALNIALGVARGSLIVVYDAEDVPAPDQLRLAAERFAAEPDLDCLQARLVIHNGDDSWLAKMFEVEYAVLFDLVNPGLAALGLPIALGGTSNHFRTRSLREAGGWDAWNVTEDADLGIRLARARMRIGALASDTLEEGPNQFYNWFRQRVRWQKGWMQTLIVHSRRPRRVIAELGPWGALSAFSLIAGGVSGGLFGTAFALETLARLLITLTVPGYNILWWGDVFTVGLFLWGVQSVVVPVTLVMRRRRIRGLATVLSTLLFYYTLISVASWTALYELVTRPFHWGKTDHGLAKPPKRGRQRVRLRQPRRSSSAGIKGASAGGMG